MKNQRIRHNKKDCTRKIYVLLTRLPDSVSHTLAVIKSSYYTHASIGLEEDLNTFYTFAYKGFRIEKVSVYVERNHNFPCVLYEIDVPEKVYEETKKKLFEFVENKHEYSYSFVGVILGLIYVPHKFKKRYFCSQFVSEILKDCKIVELHKSTSTFFPGDFRNIKDAKLRMQGNLKSLQELLPHIPGSKKIYYR